MRTIETLLQKNKRTKNKPEYLYILSCGDKIKIGVTNDIEQRLKNLQTGNPVPIILEHFEEKRQAYKVESYLHTIFDKNRISGEWFQGITVRDVRVKLMMCHEYD